MLRVSELLRVLRMEQALGDTPMRDRETVGGHHHHRDESIRERPMRMTQDRPEIKSCTFTDLGGLTLSIAVVESLGQPESIGHALGHADVSDEEGIDFLVRVLAGEPRLGMIVTLVHEMMHAAEFVTGYGIPHSFIQTASFGAVVALARAGVLGADDAEIRALIAYAQECEAKEPLVHAEEDPEAQDPVEELERMHAALAQANERIAEQELQLSQLRARIGGLRS